MVPEDFLVRNAGRLGLVEVGRPRSESSEEFSRD